LHILIVGYGKEVIQMAIKIYIDQGHNPVNPNAGAEGNGLREQDLVYRIGQELAMLLRRDGNFDVRLSRPTEATQIGESLSDSLRTRVSDANSWGADYFWSLHTNASDITSASGVEAYAYSRPSRAFSLGEQIVRAISEVTGLPDRGMKVRTNLYVLRRTAMPAVLIELGFITNPGDAALMSEQPQLFAQGIYQGLLAYLGL
jgi:N-acetylmuramoyl-L-alanine amidase